MKNSNDLSIFLKAQLDHTRSVNSINAQIKQMEKELKFINLNLNVENLRKITNDYNTIKKEVESKPINLNTDSANSKFKELNSEIGKMVNFNPATTPIHKGMEIIGYSVKDVKDGVKTFTQELNDGKNNIIKYNGEINTTANTYEVLGKTVRQATRENNTFVKELGIAVQRTITWSLAVGSYYKLLRTIQKDGIQYINELNKSLTEIGMVAQLNANQLKTFSIEINNMAKTMSQLTRDMVDSAVLYFRQGKSQAEVLELVRSTTIAASIANMNLAETTDYLTSTLNGYQMSSEQVMDVVDKFSYVGANAATSFEEIATAMSKTASSANIAGVGIDKLTSYIATVSDVTRESANSIGQSFKTIFARFTNVTTTGFDEDGMGINEVEKALSRINVSLRDSSGQFRNLEDVIDDVGGKFNTLTKVEQNYIATVLAGVRQKDRLVALFANYSKSLELAEMSTNSAGKALEQYQVYLQSNEAAMKRFKAEQEGFFMSLIDSEQIKSFIELGTSGIKTLDTWINGFGMLNTVLLGVIPLIGIKFVLSMRSAVASMIEAQIASGATVSGITSMGAGFKALVAQLIGVKTASDGAKVSLLGLSLATATLTAGLTLIPILINKIISAERKRKEAMQESIQSASNLKNEIDVLQNLQSEYDSLIEKQKQGIDVKNELISVQERLASLFPELATGVNEEGKAYADSAEIIRQYTQDKKDLLEIELLAIKSRAEREVPQLEKEIESLENRISQLKTNLETGNTSTVEIFRRNGQEIEIARDKTEEYSKELGDLIVKLQEKRNQLNDNKSALETYNSLIKEKNKSLGESSDAIDDVNQSLENQLLTTHELQGVVKSAEQNLQLLDKAQKELDDTGHLSIGTLQELISKYDDFIDIQHSSIDTIYDFIKAKQDEQVAFINAERAKTQELISAHNQRLELYRSELEMLKALMTAQATWSSIAYYDSVAGEIGSIEQAIANAQKRLGFLDYLDKSFAKRSGTSPSSKSSSSSTPYAAQADQYYELNNAITQVSNALDKLNTKMQTASDVDKITLLSQQNELYKQQTVNIENLMKAKEDEKQSLKAMLETHGFVFNRQSGQITNYEAQLNKINTIYKSKPDTIKEIENAIKGFTNLQYTEIPSFIKEIDNIGVTVSKNALEIENMTYSLMRSMLDMERKMAELDMQQRIKQSDAEITRMQSRVNSQVDSIQKEIDDLQKEIDRINEQERARKERVQREEYLSEITELQNKLYYLQSDEIATMSEERAKQLGIEKEVAKYQEEQLRLQELQIKLENLQKEKNIRQLQKMEDGTWDYVYVADQKAIEDTLKEIERTQSDHDAWVKDNVDRTHDELKRKQEEYDEWERQNTIRKQQENLRNQIEYKQNRIRNLQENLREEEERRREAFQIERENLQNHYIDMDILTEDSLAILLETTEDGWSAVHREISQTFDSIKQEYEELIRILSQPLPAPGISEGGSVASGRSTRVTTTDPVTGRSSTTVTRNYHTGGIVESPEVLHSGGRVGDGSRDLPEIVNKFFNAKPNEQMVKALEGELFIPEENLRKNFLPNMNTLMSNAIPKFPNIITSNKSASRDNQVININKLEFPNVRDGQDVLNTLKDLPNLAIQYVKR